MEILKREKVILTDGSTYTGDGFFNTSKVFVPHGYGWKFFQSGMKAYGFFKNGIASGPTYVDHDYMMYTMMMKNNRGNGWGIIINSGILQFGYYENSDIKLDMTDVVDWYYELMIKSGRKASMFHGYPENGEILIGYKASEKGGFMGFHFMTDSSVFVGSSESLEKTGNFIYFRNTGKVEVGRFSNGILVSPICINDLISEYYGNALKEKEVPFSSITIEDEDVHLYDDVYLDVNINYFSVAPETVSFERKSHSIRTPKIEAKSRLIGTMNSWIFPLENICNIQRYDCGNGNTLWGLVDDECMPIGYNIVQNDRSLAIVLAYRGDIEEVMKSESIQLFEKCWRVHDSTFYGKYIYVGDIISQAAHKGSSYFSTSRFGVVILPNGMYLGEFPAGYKMKKVIGKFYDLYGNVYDGIFNLPITDDPNWNDENGGIFPF